MMNARPPKPSPSLGYADSVWGVDGKTKVGPVTLCFPLFIYKNMRLVRTMLRCFGYSRSLGYVPGRATPVTPGECMVAILTIPNMIRPP